jgi:DNA-binding transcriptional MerR regulator
MSRKLPASAVAARYGRSTKTLDRWSEQGIIPTPRYINGFKFYDEAELDAADTIREQSGPRIPPIGRQKRPEAAQLRQQPRGNSVDPEQSAEQRKVEAERPDRNLRSTNSSSGE